MRWSNQRVMQSSGVVGDKAVESVTLGLAIHDVEDLLQLLLVFLADFSRLVLAPVDEALAYVRETFGLGLVDVTSKVHQAIDELMLFLRLH